MIRNILLLLILLVTLMSCDPPKDDLCYEYVTGDRFEVECD
jgi:hypothetical protein